MNPLDQIMGIREASLKWGIPSHTLTQLCAEGRVKAVRLDAPDGAWVLLKDQPAPHLEGFQPQPPQPAPPARNTKKASSMSTRLKDALWE